MRILHLEPNLSDAALTLLTLKTAFPDATLERLSSLQELSEELDELQADVVISEYQLEDGTAEQAIKLLRQKFPLVPFIVFSSVRETAIALKMLEKGASDYVFKEHRQHLASAIEEALQRTAAFKPKNAEKPEESADSARPAAAQQANTPSQVASEASTVLPNRVPEPETSTPPESSLLASIASLQASLAEKLPLSDAAPPLETIPHTDLTAHSSTPAPTISTSGHAADAAVAESPNSETLEVSARTQDAETNPPFLEVPTAHAADSPFLEMPTAPVTESPFSGESPTAAEGLSLSSEMLTSKSPSPEVSSATALDPPFIDESSAGVPESPTADEASTPTSIEEKTAEDWASSEALPAKESVKPAPSVETVGQAEQVALSADRAIDFRAIVEQLSDTVVLIDQAGIIHYASLSVETTFGCKVSELQGKNVLDFIHPDDRPIARDRLEEVVENKLDLSQQSLEVRLFPKNGLRRVVAVRARNELQNPAIRAIILAVRDITERRQQSEIRRVQARVLELLASGASLQDAMTELCLAVEAYLGDVLCSVLLIENNRLRMCAAPSLPDEYNKQVDGIAIGMNRGSCGTAAYLKTRVITEDVETDPFWEDYRDLVRPYGLRACWSTPILNNATREVIGTLALYSTEPRRPDSMELEFVEATVNVISLAIQRARMQEQLKVSEERLRAMIDAAPIGVFSCMLSGRFIEVNPAFCQMVGYTEDELLELTFQDITHPDDLSISVESDEKLLRGEVPHYTLQKRYLHKNGQPVYVRVRTGLARHADGSPAYLVSQVEDITEVTQTAKALEESNAKLSMILRSINDGVFRFRVYPNRDFEYDFFSPSCEKVFGFTPEEMLQDKFLWMNNVYADDRKHAIEEAYAKIFEGESITREYRFHRKDGALRWLESTLSPQFDAEQDCWIVVGVARDITERKDIESALAQSEEQYRTLVSHSKDGVYLVQEMKFVFANHSLLRLLGRSSEELIGCDVLEVIAPEDRHTILELAQQFEKQTRISGEYEVRLLHKSGRRITAIVTVATTLYQGLPAAIGTVKDITEKKEFEQALRQSEAELKAIFNSIPYSITLCDRELIVRAQNQNAFEVAKSLSSTPLRIGDPILQWLETAEEQSYARKELEAVLAGETRFFEAPLLRQGKKHWVEVRITPVRDVQNQIMGICIVAANITERKQAEEKLRFQAQVLEQMREAVLAIDAQGYISFANRAAEAFHGVTRGEMIGRRSEEVMRYKYLSKTARQEAKAALEQAGAWQGEVIYQSHHSGTERIVSLSLAKLQGRDEKSSGLLCVLEDVTEQRKAEVALAQSQAQLREIVENNPVVLFSLNALGVFSLAIGKGLEKLGYDSHSLIGKSVYQLFSRNTVFLADIAKALSGESLSNQAAFEECFFEYHLSPLYDERKKVVGVLGVALDNTQKHYAELEREALQAKLIQAQKMEALGTLTGGIAHDFNNLLAAISGNLELLKMLIGERTDLATPVARAESATNRAIAITRQLLGFARQNNFSPKPLSINAVIESTLTIMEHTLDKRINIRKSLAPDLPLIYGDENQLQQVFVNLAVNAADALMPSRLDSGEAFIAFTTALLQDKQSPLFRTLDKDKDYVHIQVSDNGIGISAELQKKIFEPFFTTKEVGKGTGLGLS
ncbi:MAG: PAS domain S-box protein, partial [Chloroherpetonaceae bacterium]|nr:PAS domain S-box protein [Chloroherpetonaceae bacterium]